jgi:hypothetical protein
MSCTEFPGGNKTKECIQAVARRGNVSFHISLEVKYLLKLLFHLLCTYEKRPFMLDDMRVNDEQLDVSDIRQLESADEIAHFFAKLRYDVDERTHIPDYGVLGTGSEDMRQHIHKIELIGKDPEGGRQAEELYAFTVKTVSDP